MSVLVMKVLFLVLLAAPWVLPVAARKSGLVITFGIMAIFLIRAFFACREKKDRFRDRWKIEG